MTAFQDISSFNSYYNVTKKLGLPGDTEVLASGIERIWTNSVFAKLDIINSGIQNIDLAIDVTLAGAVWADGFEVSGSMLAATVPFISGKLSTLQTQMGANTKSITDKIDAVVLGQIWQDGFEPSGSLLNASISSRATQTSVDLISGMIGILPGDLNSINLADVSTMSGFMVPNIKSDILQNFNYLSGMLGILPTEFSVTLDLSGQTIAVTLDPEGTWDDRFLPSGSLLPTIDTKIDVLSGLIGILPGDISALALENSVGIVSGLLGIIPTDLSSLSSQSSLDDLSGIVGLLPNDLTDIYDFVQYVSTDPATESAATTNYENLSGMIGILPTDNAAVQSSLDLISGLVSAIPAIETPLVLTKGTYFKTKTASAANYGSGIFVGLYSGLANADMTINAFTISDASATMGSNKVKILDKDGIRIFPYTDGVSYTPGTENVLTDQIGLVSGMSYFMQVYCESISGGTGTATLSSMKIIERI